MRSTILAVLAAATVSTVQAGAEACNNMKFGKNPTVASLKAQGWSLQRRVKRGSRWHPAVDHATGSEKYGKCDHNAHSTQVIFSCKWNHLKFDQMLFTSGDHKVWLQTGRYTATAMFGSNIQRKVIASSGKAGSYLARWYNRNGVREDPWISIFDHWHNNRKDQVYGEAAVNAHAHGTVPREHNGANVYIRNRDGCLKRQARLAKRAARMAQLKKLRDAKAKIAAAKALRLKLARQAAADKAAKEKAAREKAAAILPSTGGSFEDMSFLGGMQAFQEAERARQAFMRQQMKLVAHRFRTAHIFFGARNRAAATRILFMRFNRTLIQWRKKHAAAVRAHKVSIHRMAQSLKHRLSVLKHFKLSIHRLKIARHHERSALNRYKHARSTVAKARKFLKLSLKKEAFFKRVWVMHQKRANKAHHHSNKVRAHYHKSTRKWRVARADEKRKRAHRAWTNSKLRVAFERRTHAHKIHVGALNRARRAYANAKRAAIAVRRHYMSRKFVF